MNGAQYVLWALLVVLLVLCLLRERSRGAAAPPDAAAAPPPATARGGGLGLGRVPWGSIQNILRWKGEMSRLDGIIAQVAPSS